MSLREPYSQTFVMDCPEIIVGDPHLVIVPLYHSYRIKNLTKLTFTEYRVRDGIDKEDGRTMSNSTSIYVNASISHTRYHSCLRKRLIGIICGMKGL